MVTLAYYNKKSGLKAPGLQPFLVQLVYQFCVSQEHKKDAWNNVRTRPRPFCVGTKLEYFLCITFLQCMQTIPLQSRWTVVLLRNEWNRLDSNNCIFCFTTFFLCCIYLWYIYYISLLFNLFLLGNIFLKFMLRV